MRIFIPMQLWRIQWRTIELSKLCGIWILWQLEHLLIWHLVIIVLFQIKNLLWNTQIDVRFVLHKGVFFGLLWFNNWHLGFPCEPDGHCVVHSELCGSPASRIIVFRTAILLFTLSTQLRDRVLLKNTMKQTARIIAA